MDEPIRIEKYLSQEGIMSRREAQTLIKAGGITLNGKTIRETGIKINPIQDEIGFVEGGKIQQTAKQTVLVYKPRGVICAKDAEKHKSVFDVWPRYAHLNTVGRLDKESEGLLLLSNDGMVTKAITGKDHLTEKEYKVTVREDVLPWMIEKMESGMKLDDGMTLPASAKKISQHVFQITLREGRKHQIRRMANKLKLTVERLERIRIAHLGRRDLKGRRLRILPKSDIEKLKQPVRPT